MTIQERWNSTFEKLDRACPAQRADEGSTDYLRRLSRIGKKYIPRDEQMASSQLSRAPRRGRGEILRVDAGGVERNLFRSR